MTGTLVVVGVLLLLLAWFFWPSSADTPPTPPDPMRKARPGVDERELERAERDVQEAADEESVRDWGPGTQKPLL